MDIQQMEHMKEVVSHVLFAGGSPSLIRLGRVNTKGRCDDDVVEILDCPHCVIERLLREGFNLSCDNGTLTVYRRL